jgi:hypothetical protein
MAAVATPSMLFVTSDYVFGFLISWRGKYKETIA